MSKGNRTTGPRKGRPKLAKAERTEPHLVRVLPATWRAMVAASAGPRSVGAMLDERFAPQR